MAFQIVLVVEANEKSKTDFIYINSILNYVYNIRLRNDIKISPVYMGGKGNYKSRKVEKEINRLINQYSSTSKNNRSMVLYCIDCDNFDSDPDAIAFLNGVREYCKTKQYRFIWFCRDIEHVFLGKQIRDDQKTKEAENFAEQRLIERFDVNKLLATDKENGNYKIGYSNLCSVLDEYLKRKL